MKKIFTFGITGNALKLIALITMILDHVGYYFASELNYNVLITLRWLGRMSMPIYTYLIVQGFFYTKDFKKYITRILTLAFVTQICISFVGYIGCRSTKLYYPQVLFTFNVLYTYTLVLLILKLLHERIIIKKWDYTRNLSVRVAIILLLSAAIILSPLDYSYIGLALSILFYIIEKIKTKFMIRTESFRQLINRFTKFDASKLIRVIYLALILLALVVLAPAGPYPLPMILAIVPIALYNGERGNKSKILKYGYYAVFPLQHVVLYSLAIIFVLT